MNVTEEIHTFSSIHKIALALYIHRWYLYFRQSDISAIGIKDELAWGIQRSADQR